MKLYPIAVIGPIFKSSFCFVWRTSWITPWKPLWKNPVAISACLLVLALSASVSARADRRTCIAQLPYRLTSEYKVRGWDLTLPNSLGLGNLLYHGALAYQSVQSFGSFGNPVAMVDDGASNGSAAPLFFAPYTKPLIYGFGYAAEVYQGVKKVLNLRELRVDLKGITFLTYGAHMAMPQAEAEMGDFQRRLEPSEKARGISAFEKLVRSVAEDPEGLPPAENRNWANLILNADRLGLLCSGKSLYRGLDSKDIRRLFVERVRTRDLEREIQEGVRAQIELFKDFVRAGLPRFEEVRQASLDFEFTQQDFERWHPVFYKFILDDLGAVVHETLEERFVKVKFYKYLVTRIPDQLVNFRAPWFRLYVPAEI